MFDPSHGVFESYWFRNDATVDDKYFQSKFQGQVVLDEQQS